jgi:hypothetical protein
LPDKGHRINNQIIALRLELRGLYKSLKEMGEIPSINEAPKPVKVEAPNFADLEPSAVKKNYARPGGKFYSLKNKTFTRVYIVF